MRESIQRGLGLVVLFLCLGPTCAEATDNGRNGRQSQPNVHRTSNTSSNSSSFSASGSFSAAAGGQAEGGSAEATGGNVGDVASSSNSEGGTSNATGGTGTGGNSSVGDLSINNTTNNPGSVKIRNTPTTVAPDVFPTAPCFRTGALSGSGPGLGFSWGGGKIDPGCESREEIRLAASFGLIDRALFRWCQLPNNIESFGSLEKCLEFDPVEEEEPIAAYETVADEPMLLAEVTEEQFEAAVENARIREEKQALLMAELLKRLKEQEKAQKETDQLENYRQQQIEDYKAKYDESEDSSNG